MVVINVHYQTHFIFEAIFNFIYINLKLEFIKNSYQKSYDHLKFEPS